MRKHSHNGFTLVELLVVLAIIAIISSISFGAFKSISQGNKRTSCQSNLAQIFKSVRLYSQDYDGRLPYLNEDGDPNMPPFSNNYSDIRATPKGGIGLWSLYTFRKPGFQAPDVLPPNSFGNTNCSVASVDLPAQFEDPTRIVQGSVGLAGYVRSAKIFHCPADNFKREVQYRDLTDNSSPTNQCKVVTANSPTLLIPDGDYTYLNPSYLSYQVKDDYPLRVPGNANTGDSTYSSFRRPERVDTGPKNPVRQVMPYRVESGVTKRVERATKDMTVLTWCRFHRSLDNDTGATISNKRAFDNVLFSDGSVQSLPAVQDVRNTSGATGTCTGWQRVPREKAENMSSQYQISDCVPSP